jgi:protein-S-isoprenylcysteine O-methyltransferase Ste14
MKRFLIPPVWFLLSGSGMLVIDRIAPGATLLREPWTWAGMLPVSAGIGLAVWAAWQFRRARTPLEPWERPSAFVTSGPYRLSRNPMYAGLAACLVGLGISLGSLTPFVFVPAFLAIIEREFIRREERWLEELFGCDYLAYKARVHRWI